MQSIGMVVCALPWARARGLSGDALAEWVRPRLGFANTNPYLAGLLLGSILRLREDGKAQLAGRLESALSRSLGALGDAFFWEGVRPAWAFLFLAAALFAGPWAVFAGWLSFALVQAVVRWWGWKEGFRRGVGVADLLDRPWVQRAVEFARRLAAVAVGMALALFLARQDLPARATVSLAWAAGALACGLLAAWRRWPMEWILPVMAVAGWFLMRLGSQ